ncbi:hypothetical protein ACFFRR_003993 [Megaselia abdita]
MSKFCIKCGQSRKSGFTVHKFPSNPHARKKWLEFCELDEVPENARLCEDHFSDGYRSQLSVPDVSMPKESYQMKALNRNSIKASEYWGPLIAEIQRRPTFWNNQNTLKSRSELKTQWIEIAETLKQPQELLKNKWKYLEARFKREVLCQLRLGDKYKSKWYLYKQMEFLMDHFKNILEYNNGGKLVERVISPLKNKYWLTLLEEVRTRPAIWDTKFKASPSEIDKCWVDIARNVVWTFERIKALKSRAKYNRKCFAKGCTSTDMTPCMRFFRFPPEPTLRKKWVELLGVEKPSPNMFACVLHFNNKLWETRKLFHELPNKFDSPMIKDSGCRKDWLYMKFKFKRYLQLQVLKVPKTHSPFLNLFEKMNFIKPHLIYSLVKNSETSEEESVLENYPSLIIDDGEELIETGDENKTTSAECQDEQQNQIMSERINTNESLPSRGIVEVGGIRKVPRTEKREKDFPALIKEVEKRPILWDSTHILHTNRNALTNSWDQIGDALAQKYEEGRKQWYFLVMKFKKQLQEELDAISENRACESNFDKELYEQMSFLKPQFTAEILRSTKTSPVTNVFEIQVLEEPSFPKIEDIKVESEEDLKMEIKVESAKDLKTEIKVEPIEVDNEHCWNQPTQIPEDVKALVKSEPELIIEDIPPSEDQEQEEETIYIEVIETTDEEAANILPKDEVQNILSEEGVPPTKKIKLSDSKSDEEYLKNLLPYFKRMTEDQKKRIQRTIETLINEELKL